MPSPTGDSRHLTLTANTVATVPLDADYQHAEVVNVDGAAAVYFTVDGPTPTVEGDGTVILPAVIGGVEVAAPGTTATVTTVRLISAGTPKISVRGW